MLKCPGHGSSLVCRLTADRSPTGTFSSGEADTSPGRRRGPKTPLPRKPRRQERQATAQMHGEVNALALSQLVRCPTVKQRPTLKCRAHGSFLIPRSTGDRSPTGTCPRTPPTVSLSPTGERAGERGPARSAARLVSSRSLPLLPLPTDTWLYPCTASAGGLRKGSELTMGNAEFRVPGPYDHSRLRRGLRRPAGLTQSRAASVRAHATNGSMSCTGVESQQASRFVDADEMQRRARPPSPR
jgi:hypothetical protein